MKNLLRMLIGAVVGFFVMYGVLALRGSFKLDFPLFTFVIVVVVIGSISMLLSFIWTWQLHQRTKGNVEHEDQDAFETMVYNKYGDITLATSVSTILFLLSLTISIIQDVHYMTAIVAAIGLLLGYIVLPISYNATKRAYAYRDFPAISEKDYAKRIMELADEGERHMMLKGFSKVYLSMNVLIPLGMLFLMFYSSMTNNPQIAGIIVLTAIYIYTNARYLVTVRAK